MATKTFFDKIRKATFESGGFFCPKMGEKVFVVLEGEYTGTWYFFAYGRVTWSPYLSTNMGYVAHYGRKNKAKALQEWRTKKLEGKDLLYVMAQIAGKPVEEVRAQVVAEPRRALTLEHSKIPTHHKDKVRYCKVLLETWSHQKAVKACLPNVRGWNPLFDASSIDYRKVRQLLNNWDWCSQIREQTQLNSLLYSGVNDTLGKDTVALLQRYGLERTKEIADVINGFQINGARYTQEHRGRQILQAIEEKNWREVLRGHPWMVENNRVFYEEQHRLMQEDYQRWLQQYRKNTRQDEELSAEWHNKAKQFVCPEGVRPLCTKEQMAQEGAEMLHCVAGYFVQRRSHIFAFKDGEERATLEWCKGAVVQFQGVRNGRPDDKMYKLLDEFKKLNK